jgi:hypothetical protein
MCGLGTPRPGWMALRFIMKVSVGHEAVPETVCIRLHEQDPDDALMAAGSSGPRASESREAQ